jgi:hypothetical protein
MFKVPNEYRIRIGDFASSEKDGNNGAFKIPMLGCRYDLLAIASNGEEWEHVSVSLSYRTPNWEEMCYIKSLFWDDEDCVVQYHPPKSEYVNFCKNCLHMWRPIGIEIVRPPKRLIGGIQDE